MTVAVRILCDAGVFMLVAVIAILVPLWKRLHKKRRMTKSEYVFGRGNHIYLISAVFSIARATLGVRSFIGFPSEMFYRGGAMWQAVLGILTAFPIVCFIFLPVYFNLYIISIYHYLELR